MMKQKTKIILIIVSGLAVLAVSLLPRVTDLGQMITADERNWVERSYKTLVALKSGEWAGTYHTSQPGVSTYYAAAIGISGTLSSGTNVDEIADHIMDLLPSAQLGNAVLVSFTILMVFYLLWRLTSFPVAFLSAMLLALSPFIIAHSRVVHNDAFLSLAMLATFVSFLLYRTERRKSWLVLSAALFAMAFLAKITAVLVIGPILVIWLMDLLSKKTTLGTVIKHSVRVIIVFAVVIFILWPALWVAPKAVFYELVGKGIILPATSTAISGEIEDAYETTVGYTFQPLFYLDHVSFQLTLVTSILLVVGLGVAALLLFWKKKSDLALFNTHYALLLYIAVLYVLLTIPAYKADRYVLPLFTALITFGSVGVVLLMDWLLKQKDKIFRLKAIIIILVLIVIGQAWISFSEHPYYLAHHNTLYPVQESRKMGWGEGLEQAAIFLNSRTTERADVASWYPKELDEFYTNGKVYNLNQYDNKNIKYIVIYRGMFERNEEWMEEFFDRYYQGRAPIHTVKLNDIEYAWVYEK